MRRFRDRLIVSRWVTSQSKAMVATYRELVIIVIFRSPNDGFRLFSIRTWPHGPDRFFPDRIVIIIQVQRCLIDRVI